MTLRILLDEAGGGPSLQPGPLLPHRPTPVPVTRANGDVENTGSVMLLTLYDEPEIGRRFHYQDLEWEIVEYRNGWLARLVVDDA